MDVQDSLSRVVWEYPEHGGPEGIICCKGKRLAGGCLWEEEVDTNEKPNERQGKEGFGGTLRFIIIQAAAVLLGIQDAAGANGTAGEWSFPSRTTAPVEFPWKSCTGFCLLWFCWWGPEMQMLHSFFPADIHWDGIPCCIAYGLTV